MKCSDIGEQQVRHTRLRTRATHYRNMAVAIQAGDEQTIAAFPKYIARGKPVSWYLERAEQDMQASQKAGELAEALSAMKRQNQLDRMTVEEKCEALDDRLHTFLVLISPQAHDYGLFRDFPELLKGLSSGQKAMYRERVSRVYQEVLQLFDAPDAGQPEDGDDDGDVQPLRIRTLPLYIDTQGRPWFPLVPVSVMLGQEPRAVAEWLADDEWALQWTVIEGKPVRVPYLNEAGLVRLMLSSGHPACAKLQRWLAHVVVPSLQADGHYTCSDEAKAVLADLPTSKRAEASER
jgi:BRO family, N-terminal domain